MIVSVAELKKAMSDIDLTPEQWADAEDVLDEVQAELETWLNRPIEQGTFTEDVVTVDDGYVPLSNTPVATITEVIFNAVPTTSYVFRDGLLYYGNAPDTLLTVTYVAGLIDARATKACRRGILRVAKREIVINHDDTLSVKDLDTNDNPQLPEGWQPDELKRLDRWRRRVVV